MKYQLSEHVSLTDVDNEAVLLDLDAGHYFGLNHVGAHFLRLMEQRIDKNQAITQIAEHYAIDCNIVKDDIGDLIKQLMEKNLLQTIT